MSDKLHQFATKLKGSENQDAFSDMINEQMEKDEDERKQKKTSEKKKRKFQRREDLRQIENHFRTMRIQKKTTPEKIEEAYRKNNATASKLLQDERKYQRFLKEVPSFLEKDLPEELVYLKDEYTLLTDQKESSPEERRIAIIDLLYSMNPLVPNSLSTEDNRTIHDMASTLCLNRTSRRTSTPSPKSLTFH